MSSMLPPAFFPWSVEAVNLPEHADNRVHTVEGGLAAGYAGAVVAGTTIYAYLTRPAAAAWGAEWVAGGSAEVRFRSAVLADEPVDIVPVSTDDGVRIEARTTGGAVAATCAVALDGSAPDAPAGERLEPLVVTLDDEWLGQPARVGEDLSLYADEGLVHPVVWPALANRVFSLHLVEGPWVHTRSRIRHLGPAAPGEVAVVEAWVTDRFSTRSGDRAIADMRISVDGRTVVAIEHEAIVRLAGR